MLETINQIHQPSLPSRHTNEWSLIKTKTTGSGHSNDRISKRWVPGSAENVSGLQAPQQKNIRAPVSKMIGLRAPK